MQAAGRHLRGGSATRRGEKSTLTGSLTASGSTFQYVTPAATLDAMAKAASLNARIQTPAMQKAIAQLVEKHRIIPADQQALMARRIAKQTGLDEMAARMQRDLAAHSAFRGLEQWQARAQEMLRQHGVHARLAEIARVSFAGAPAAETWTWEEIGPDADEGGRLPVLGWLLSRPLVTQIMLLHPVLEALREFGYFLEDVSGEDIPDPVQSGSGVLLAVAVVLLVFIHERMADDS